MADRAILPFTPPNMTTILEQRLLSSVHRVPHVTARVQDSSLPAGTPETTYPLQLVAKILFNPVFSTPTMHNMRTPSCYVALVSRAKWRRTSVSGASCEQKCRGLRPLFGASSLSGRRDGRRSSGVCSRHKDAIIDAALCLN